MGSIDEYRQQHQERYFARLAEEERENEVLRRREVELGDAEFAQKLQEEEERWRQMAEASDLEYLRALQSQLSGMPPEDDNNNNPTATGVGGGDDGTDVRPAMRTGYAERLIGDDRSFLSADTHRRHRADTSGSAASLSLFRRLQDGVLGIGQGEEGQPRRTLTICGRPVTSRFLYTFVIAASVAALFVGAGALYSVMKHESDNFL